MLLHCLRQILVHFNKMKDETNINMTKRKRRRKKRRKSSLQELTRNKDLFLSPVKSLLVVATSNDETAHDDHMKVTCTCLPEGIRHGSY